jgi:hypothetical protein
MLRRMRLHRSALILLPLSLLAYNLVACDLLKKKGADDGGTDAAVTVEPTATAEPAAVDAAAAATATATAAPLGHGPTTPTVHPVAIVDAGQAVDAGAAPASVVDAGAAPVAVVDAGTAPPAPTPTLQIPTAFRRFDAGAFRPPPGFPTALPSGFPKVQ